MSHDLAEAGCALDCPLLELPAGARVQEVAQCAGGLYRAGFEKHRVCVSIYKIKKRP